LTAYLLPELKKLSRTNEVGRAQLIYVRRKKPRGKSKKHSEKNAPKAAKRRYIGCTLLAQVVLNLKRNGRYPDL